MIPVIPVISVAAAAADIAFFVVAVFVIVFGLAVLVWAAVLIVDHFMHNKPAADRETKP